MDLLEIWVDLRIGDKKSHGQRSEEKFREDTVKILEEKESLDKALQAFAFYMRDANRADKMPDDRRENVVFFNKKELEKLSFLNTPKWGKFLEEVRKLLDVEKEEIQRKIDRLPEDKVKTVGPKFRDPWQKRMAWYEQELSKWDSLKHHWDNPLLSECPYLKQFYP